MSLLRAAQRLLLAVVLPLVLLGCRGAETEAPSGDAELRGELLEMVRADQEVRERLNALMSSGSADALSTQEGRELIDEMNAVDQRNFARLDEIVARHGWPTAASVGPAAADAASLILQHADTARQKRYLPLIREAVKNGAVEPLTLAEMEDEISVAETGFQVYGTEISFDPAARAASLKPVRDPEQLDARRAEIGLPPIDEYLRGVEAELGLPVDRSALASD